MLGAPGVRAQTPSHAEENVIVVAARRYDLAALLDLAERNNPNTRAAWDAARAAAAGEGLVESAYLPQLSLQAIGGVQHTPLPAPKNLVPAGYFVSDSREIVPALALKWLLFDFGRRDAALQGVRADAFVANVNFTSAHLKLIFAVSQAYFDLGAARGRLHAAKKALSTGVRGPLEEKYTLEKPREFNKSPH